MLLSDLSIKRPVFATMMVLALVVLGVFSYRRLNVDQWPDVEFPFVGIQVRYPGAGPEAVEREVTKKVEEAVNSVEGVKQITSRSTEGYSSIFIQFNLGVKVMDALADVRAKVDGIRADLPTDIDPPVISRFNMSQEPILTFSVRGQGMALRDLTRLAEETVSRRIENIPGVGSVTVAGGMRREIHVLMLPDRMEALGVSPEMVTAALQRENVDVPAGRVERGNAENLVRVRGRIADPREFANLVVTVRGTTPVRLSQVARVEDVQQEERDAAFLNGDRTVAVEVRKVSGGNTMRIAEQVQAEVARLNHTLPGGVRIATIRDNSRWIRDSVDDVQKTLVEGGILTIFVVFLFLASWRSTVITGLTLPVSVISSFLIIYAFKFTLNTMTLMALSLVIGILIDDAIVVRENIVRHLERGEDHFLAARRGTSEIGLAVLATTLSIVAVFVPVAFMGGIVGRFFYPFGVTVTFAVLVSLFVSFTLDPMLSSRWYDPQAEGGQQHGRVGKALLRFNQGFRNLGGAYRRVIAWALDHRKLTLAVAALSFLVSLVLPALGLVGGQFMPKSDEEQTMVGIEAPVGTSLDYTKAKALEVVNFLRRQPEVAFTYATIGGEPHDNSVSKGSIFVKLTPKGTRHRSQQEFETAIRKVLPDFRGVDARVMVMGMGGRSYLPIQLNLKGPELSRLQEISDQVIASVRDVPGLVELKSSLEGRKPEWVVSVNRDAAANVGVSVGAVSNSLRTLLAGQKAGDWEDETGLASDVVVRLAPEARTSAEDIARLPISTGQVDARTGRPITVPLGQVADLRRGGAPDQINRQDLERVATVEGNYQGRPLTDIVNDLRARMAKVGLPAGYRYDFGGEQQDFAETVQNMSEALALAVVFIYLILASQFGSFLQPLAIMLSLPLSLVGAVLALLMTRGTLNIMSMIGIILLMGLVTKNAILLVDFANKARGRGLSRREALIDAGELRLRPILMTTMAMVFGMLPTALALGAGAEFRSPMAHAVIGGLITSTLLTLLVVPVVYTYLDDFGGRIGGWIQRRTSRPEETPEPAMPQPEEAPGELVEV